MKKTIGLLIGILSIFTIASCDSNNESSTSNEIQTAPNQSSVSNETQTLPSQSSILTSTEVELNSYYTGLDLTKTEEAFRKELSGIISKGYVAHAYSYNNTVLAKTDADLEVEGNVICFYTGRSLKNGEWNKEHIWAKSHGFPGATADPYCDAHHLRPTLISINSARGNSDFGEVTGGSFDDFGNKWSSTLFEPRDEVKGDVARMMFYMATRYGFDGKYNLKLVFDTTTTSSDTNGRFGNLDTLIKWHYQDPVSESEIRRNDIIFEDYQHNRNPYIDYPFFVDLAYPNPYSSEEVDQSKVDAVISKIASLPSKITLEDKTNVEEASVAYSTLNFNERKLVSNYSKLVEALTKIKELEEQKEESAWTETLDLTALSGAPTSYSKDFNTTLGERKFLFTYGGLFSGEQRLGGNKKTTLPDKYNISGATVDGSAFVCDFDIQSAEKIQFEFTKSYGTISSMFIIASTDGGATYYKVTEINGYNKAITASLQTPINGRFALVIVGTTPRVVLSCMKIATK